ncbi:eukaryotic phosphomannomutase [Pelagophyceae sp. CCMP2097]|nr:eukaryotic phosphomannomutase [Pelagophyceae sp. CCMP2097]
MAAASKRVLALFDVDGTLTPARGEISPEMKAFMATLRQKITVGVVGGSDFDKQKEQLGQDVAKEYDFSFSENGLVAYKAGVLIGRESFAAKIGEDNMQRLLNWVLRYLADVQLPIKRGTFIEFRAGMLNISPIGRNCSREERNAYEQYDLEHGIRSNMVNAMRAAFADLDLTFSIGGQISFDVFPAGWDKTFCLKFLPEADFDEVHFFGDKTFEGGNDFEIFEHPRVLGHTVTSPEDTLKQCKALWG